MGIRVGKRKHEDPNKPWPFIVSTASGYSTNVKP